MNYIELQSIQPTYMYIYIYSGHTLYIHWVWRITSSSLPSHDSVVRYNGSIISSLLKHLHGSIISDLSEVHTSWSNAQTCWHHRSHHFRRDLNWWDLLFFDILYTSTRYSQPIMRHCNYCNEPLVLHWLHWAWAITTIKSWDKDQPW